MTQTSKRMKEMIQRKVKTTKPIFISIRRSGETIRIDDFTYQIIRTRAALERPPNTELSNLYVDNPFSNVWTSQTSQYGDELSEFITNVRKLFPNAPIDYLSINLNRAQPHADLIDLVVPRQLSKVICSFHGYNILNSNLLETFSVLDCCAFRAYGPPFDLKAINLQADFKNSMYEFMLDNGMFYGENEIFLINGTQFTNRDANLLIERWKNGGLERCRAIKVRNFRNFDMNLVSNGLINCEWNSSIMERYFRTSQAILYDLKGHIIFSNDDVATVRYVEEDQMLYIIFWKVNDLPLRFPNLI
ncbi:Protein CBG27856 [Caenorhabditis briggsae]|nr:Protein CBG27856 [Caenorhabditis briggsae]ULT83448.1 hypothetical protein L3Y34_012585 [Caenorhabditis briggsae]CAR98281.1 Protein CBG27856 [Caenorhabditis briggsae]